MPQGPAHVVQRRLSALSVSARKRSYGRSVNSFEVKPVSSRTLRVGPCDPRVHRCRRSPPMNRRCGSSTPASTCHPHLSVRSFLVAIRLQFDATVSHVATSSRPVPPLRAGELAATRNLHARRVIGEICAIHVCGARDWRSRAEATAPGGARPRSMHRQASRTGSPARTRWAWPPSGGASR